MCLAELFLPVHGNIPNEILTIQVRELPADLPTYRIPPHSSIRLTLPSDFHTLFSPKCLLSIILGINITGASEIPLLIYSFQTPCSPMSAKPTLTGFMSASFVCKSLDHKLHQRPKEILCQTNSNAKHKLYNVNYTITAVFLSSTPLKSIKPQCTNNFL